MGSPSSVSQLQPATLEDQDRSGNRQLLRCRTAAFPQESGIRPICFQCWGMEPSLNWQVRRESHLAARRIDASNQRLRAEELLREWRPERERALAGAQFLARLGR